eukprot:TRINITY_DN32170_c0_g1_i2.p1 TRINITY_DN32170_c0_g1~~TRINITY_DN32170_c0_g1_i2.p1  ORF type:complete len:102 (-),score=27.39 TRINITY_DN32170_c0_g1_i2:164-469(-)
MCIRDRSTWGKCQKNPSSNQQMSNFGDKISRIDPNEFFKPKASKDTMESQGKENQGPNLEQWATQKGERGKTLLECMEKVKEDPMSPPQVPGKTKIQRSEI